MNFDNKVAIVTGAAGGIGKALGRIFLMKGAKVCLCDINEADGKKIVQPLKEEFGAEKVIFYKCDVTKDEDFEGAFIECEKEFGTVDILCNNAGISNDVNSTMAVNFFGVVRGTELAFKRIGKHNGGKGGCVVNIASVAGLGRFPCLAYYSSSKAATIQYSRDIGILRIYKIFSFIEIYDKYIILNFPQQLIMKFSGIMRMVEEARKVVVKSLIHEFNYKYSGVSVLCLCPDVVDTGFSQQHINLQGSINSYTDEGLKQLTASISETLSPMEVAEAAVQLLNDNKTGSVLAVEIGVPPFYVPPSLMKEY